MAAATRRTIHVHDAEVSTEADSMWDYAEMLALLVALVAFLAACWIVSSPSEGADLLQPAPPQTAHQATIVTPAGDVYQPNVDGPQEVVATPAS